MEPIQRSLKKVMTNDFNAQFEKLKQEVLQNEQIAEFLNQHQDVVNDKLLQRSMGKLYEFLGQAKSCQECGTVEECKNVLKGYHPSLILEGNRINVRYEKCDLKLRAEERSRLASLFQSMYIPKDILKADFASLYHGTGRLKVVEKAAEFIKNYREGKFQKGLYLHGSFGIGKTYLLSAMANELTKSKVKSLLIYTPEFMREIKNSFKDQSTNEKIESIKKVPILMLDDIGAETMSSWFRDEVLGTVLQYRMMEQLPVFFTSNLSYRELEHHLTYTQRGEVEEIKAARIMQRIKALSESIEMTGKNYREETD